jgi:hypothetical protein
MLRTVQFASAEDILRTLCGSEHRFRILRVLFEHPLEPLTLTSLAKAADTDAGNTLRLLRTFVASSLIEVVETPTNRRYRPRRDLPLFHQLRALFSPDNFLLSGRSSHAKLDEHKRRIGELLLEHHTLGEIRTKSLENLKRWRAKGTWNGAYEDWKGIIEHGSNAQLVQTMTGRDEESNRLRQSMPYVGLLDRKLVRQLNEKVAA